MLSLLLKLLNCVKFDCKELLRSLFSKGKTFYHSPPPHSSDKLTLGLPYQPILVQWLHISHRLWLLVFCDTNLKADWAAQWFSFLLVIQYTQKNLLRTILCSLKDVPLEWLKRIFNRRVYLTQFCLGYFSDTSRVWVFLFHCGLLLIILFCFPLWDLTNMFTCVFPLHCWTPDWCAIIFMCPSAGC